MTGPRGHRADELDAEAIAALQAFRAADEMPAAAQARVWARLSAATAEEETGPNGHVYSGMRAWAWGAVVLAAAAGLLLASRTGVLGPLVAGRGGEAASYVERPETARQTATTRGPEGRARRAGDGPEERSAGGEDDLKDMSEETVASGGASGPGVAGKMALGTGSEGGRRQEPRPRGRGDAGLAADTGGPGEDGADVNAAGRKDAADGGTAVSTLAREAEALARAQAAIQGGRAEEALSLLSDYARRFPDGALREEHDALRALALCTAGRRIEGRGEARAFLRAHGGSALAERVRRGCLDE